MLALPLRLMLTDEYRYKVLKLLDENPELSQRELAKRLDISLGKLNYCLKALIAKGMVKATNFKNSRNKQAYAYLLTPKGVEIKARLTVEFLRVKVSEHHALQKEIQELRGEVEKLNRSASSRHNIRHNIECRKL